MNPIILRLIALLLLAQPLAADDLQIIVADSGSKEVDFLVAQLVSRRPHPFPPSGRIPVHIQEKHFGKFGKYITKEADESIEKLKKLGPGSSPYLLYHIDDDRYCYSTQLPSTSGGDYSGWIMVTVGEVARDIITGGFESQWLYKWRQGSNDDSFPPPYFSDFLETQGGLRKWVTLNSKKPKSEVFTKFVDWCITTERGRGFRTKEEELQLLARYQEWKQKIKHEDTGSTHAPKESKTEGDEELESKSENRSR